MAKLDCKKVSEEKKREVIFGGVIVCSNGDIYAYTKVWLRCVIKDGIRGGKRLWSLL